ncbi:MAG TPA: pirin family protein [Balneolaceae bacterium]|nr:pirin family protein [Balneolaceae bacterium]
MTANIKIRRSADRGFEDFGWTDNWMTFSFAGYSDPDWVHFGPLRVIVENHIQPYQGFDTHPHRDMEILTYVSSGILTHEDSMGNKGAIRSGEMQRITAGSGIVHSEMNEHDEVEHNIQIWILPDEADLEPSYEELRFSDEEQRGTLRMYVSPDGRGNSMHIHQDAFIYAGILEEGDRFVHELGDGRGAWIQVVHGLIELNGDQQLKQGDGAGITGWDELSITASEESEIILFDVAMDFQTPYRL